MPRPRKCRWIEALPSVRYFKPQGVPLRFLNEVALAGGVKAVLTGFVGPKAFQALQAARIEIGQNLDGLTVREAVERYKQGRVKAASQPNR